MFGFNLEQPVHLVEHFPVLTGDGDDRRAMARRRERMDQGSHLDRFGARAIDDEYFAHGNFLYPELTIILANDGKRTRPPLSSFIFSRCNIGTCLKRPRACSSVRTDTARKRSTSANVLCSAAATRIAQSTLGRNAVTSSLESMGGRSYKMMSGPIRRRRSCNTFAASKLCSSSAENCTG